MRFIARDGNNVGRTEYSKPANLFPRDSSRSTQLRHCFPLHLLTLSRSLFFAIAQFGLNRTRKNQTFLRYRVVCNRLLNPDFITNHLINPPQTPNLRIIPVPFGALTSTLSTLIPPMVKKVRQSTQIPSHPPTLPLKIPLSSPPTDLSPSSQKDKT